MISQRYALDVVGKGPGTLLCRGTKKSNLGAYFLLRTAGSVSPDVGRLDSIRADPELWGRFLQGLRSRKGFEECGTLDEVEAVLMARCSGYHNARKRSLRVMAPDLRIRVVRPGALLAEGARIDREALEAHLLSGEWLTASEFEALVPLDIGQEADATGLNMHTLLLLPAFMAEVTGEEGPVTHFDGTVITVGCGTLRVGAEAGAEAGAGSAEAMGTIHRVKLQQLLPFTGRVVPGRVVKHKLGAPYTVGVRVPAATAGDPVLRRNEGQLRRLLTRLFAEAGAGAGVDFESRSAEAADIEDCLTVALALTASQLKSLVQKIVRRVPDTVTLTPDGGRPVPADVLLAAAGLALLTHPGGFNPQLGTFPSGLEAFCRRVPITAFEDGNAPADAEAFAGMMAVAMADAQGVGIDVPESLVLHWIDVLRRQRLDETAVRYDHWAGMPMGTADVKELRIGQAVAPASEEEAEALARESTAASLELCAALLGSQSFPTDCAMLRHTAWLHHMDREALGIDSHWVTCRSGTNGEEPLAMLLDQHCSATHSVLFALPAAGAFAPRALADIAIDSGSYRFGGPVFHNYLKLLFRNLGGLNPRRPAFEGPSLRSLSTMARFADRPASRPKGDDRSPFVAVAEAAQRLSQLLTFGAGIPGADASSPAAAMGPPTLGTYRTTVTLDPLFLSGAVGDLLAPENPHTGRGPQVIVVLNKATDGLSAITDATVVYKPVRGRSEYMVPGDVAERHRAALLSIARSEGVAMPGAEVEGGVSFRGARLTTVVLPPDGQEELEEGEGGSGREQLAIRFAEDAAEGGRVVPWSTASKVSLAFDQLPIDANPAHFADVRSTGGLWLTHVLTLCDTAPNAVAVGADAVLATVCREVPLEALRRLLAILQLNQGTRLAMPAVGREGGGTDTAVTITDPIVFRVLLWMAYTYPAALVPVRGAGARFAVRSPMLLRDLRLRIVKAILGERTDESASAAASVPASAAAATGLRAFFGLDAGAGAGAAGASSDPSGFVVDSRSAWRHQELALQDLYERYGNGAQGGIISIEVGMGKSRIAIDTYRWLAAQGLASYLIFVLPTSAMESVALEAMEHRGGRVTLLIGSKSSKIPTPSGADDLRGDALTVEAVRSRRGHMLMVPHDELRKGNVSAVLRELAPFSFTVLDEVHEMFYSTQRTAHGLSLAQLGLFLAMTGTFGIDAKMTRAQPWLQLLAPYEVRVGGRGANFFAAASLITQFEAATGVRVEAVTERFSLEGEALAAYRAVAPAQLGGTKANGAVTSADLATAVRLCHDAATPRMVDIAAEHMESDGVFMVARDAAHVEELRDLMIAKIVALLRSRGEPDYSSRAEALVQVTGVAGAASVCYTARGPSTPWVVITRIRFCTGYTLTAFGTMVTSVYFSNQATRRQIEGRINRIGQRRSTVRIYTVEGELLSYVRDNYKSAAALEGAIMAAAGSRK